MVLHGFEYILVTEPMGVFQVVIGRRLLGYFSISFAWLS